MEREVIIKKYNFKIKELNEHNKLYYDKNSPKLTDSEYDKLKKVILDLEKKYNFLDHEKSPSKNVSFEQNTLIAKRSSKSKSI